MFYFVHVYFLLNPTSEVNENCSVFAPHGLYSSWNSPGQNTGVGCHGLLQGIFPTQGWNLSSPALQGDSLLSKLPGKPKKTGVGSLSLLQGIFLTQGLNWGFLHCRQTLYQLSYQGSPVFVSHH